jgi:iron complex outermembrane receptor protein
LWIVPLHMGLSFAFIESADGQVNTSVVTQVQDAFGERIGTEQLGLYSESQVRGFSLQSAGNYRIDNHYFVRAAQLPDSVLDGVSIHVGTSALRTDFPSPSGVVGLRLKKAPSGATGMAIETGMRRYETPFVQLDAWHASEDGALSWTGGAYLSADTNYADGTHGDDYSVGTVPQWRLGSLTLTGLASWSQRSFNGDYKFVSATDTLPPRLRGADLFAPHWAQSESETVNAGLTADWPLNDDWHARASVFLSDYDQPDADFATLQVDASSYARVTSFLVQDQSARAISSELSIAREFALWNAVHRIYGAVRHRASDSLSTGGEAFDVGIVDLRRPAYGRRPEMAGTAVYRDSEVEQFTSALGWELNAADRVQVRLGAQRSTYRKIVSSAGARDSTRDVPWLYDAAVIVPIFQQWFIYTSYARGLEEQGVAPGNAINRNEVLPVIEAEQIELGFKARLREGMSLVGALFEISKPTAGFDDVGRFGVVGDVRHRGWELSLTGQVVEGLSLAAGIMAFEPELSGQAVRDHRVSTTPVGVQKMAAQLSADYNVPSVPGLSLDTQVNYAGDRLARSDEAFRTPARTILDLGARYRFELNGAPAVVRLRVYNVSDVHDWTAEPSGLLSRERARTFMLTLGMTIDRDRS